jgi:putative hemolysin
MFYPELLPGGNPAPSATEIYQWVKTYEDCVKAKGQLSSEQYAQKTGIRKCVTPDGREFTQGKEGWTKAVGG